MWNPWRRLTRRNRWLAAVCSRTRICLISPRSLTSEVRIPASKMTSRSNLSIKTLSTRLAKSYNKRRPYLLSLSNRALNHRPVKRRRILEVWQWILTGKSLISCKRKVWMASASQPRASPPVPIKLAEKGRRSTSSQAAPTMDTPYTLPSRHLVTTS